jgi:glycosyltransferase involved in cell wall biosynthesis
VEVATTDADGATGRLAQGDGDLGVPVHLFRRTFSERWKYSGELAAWLRRHVGEYDLLHIHALWSHSSSTAAAAACQSGVPYILRPAGMLSDYSWGHRGWSKRVYWWLRERSTVGRAAAVHATTAAEADDVRRLCPTARVFVIPNGVEEAAWQQAAVQQIRPNSQPVILFLSRLHPVKGVTDLLLPAVAKMQTTARLVIAGGADDHAPDYAAAVRSDVARLNLTDRVTLTGAVAADDRWALFDAADLFVLPSHSENFGIVVAEAMARGRAVVITDGVQLAQQIRQADAGRVVGRDVEQLAAALDELCADQALRERLGQNGREYCRTHFAWPAIAAAVGRMYDEVLAGRQL